MNSDEIIEELIALGLREDEVDAAFMVIDEALYAEYSRGYEDGCNYTAGAERWNFMTP